MIKVINPIFVLLLILWHLVLGKQITGIVLICSPLNLTRNFQYLHKVENKYKIEQLDLLYMYSWLVNLSMN